MNLERIEVDLPTRHVCNLDGQPQPGITLDESLLRNGLLCDVLGDLLNSFKRAGHGAVADSWVTPAMLTQGLTPEQVQQAVGSADLAELSQRTGLSRDDLLKRLATAIAETVDTLTPGGQMPTEEQVRKKLTGQLALPSASPADTNDRGTLIQSARLRLT